MTREELEKRLYDMRLDMDCIGELDELEAAIRSLTWLEQCGHTEDICST